MAQTSSERKSAQRKLAGGANPIVGMGAMSAKAGAKARAMHPSPASIGAAFPSAHPETAPVSASPTPPTGTEHLSGSQFGGKPAGQSSSMIPGAMGMSHGAVKRTTSMHPGGAGMGGQRFVVSTPKPKANPNYITGGGNTVASGKASPNMNAPRTSSGPAQSAGSAYWSGLGMGGPAKPRVRGNPKPMGSSASKSGPRAAVRQKLGGGSKSSGRSGRLGILRIGKSRYEGANAKNLKSATGSA